MSVMLYPCFVLPCQWICLFCVLRVCEMFGQTIISMKLGMYNQFRFVKQLTSKYIMSWRVQVQKKQLHVLTLCISYT